MCHPLVFERSGVETSSLMMMMLIMIMMMMMTTTTLQTTTGKKITKNMEDKKIFFDSWEKFVEC